METNVGYGPDFVEVTDGPGGGGQSILIPIAAWDNYVKDYLANRRAAYQAAGLVDGAMFDDKTHDAEF